VFFSVNEFRRRGRSGFSAREHFLRGWSQLYDIEDWVEASEREREAESVSIESDSSFNFIWSETAVGEFL